MTNTAGSPQMLAQRGQGRIVRLRFSKRSKTLEISRSQCGGMPLDEIAIGRAAMSCGELPIQVDAERLIL